jgi:hypothetical protein
MRSEQGSFCCRLMAQVLDRPVGLVQLGVDNLAQQYSLKE